MTSISTRNEPGGASVEPTDADVYVLGEGALGAAVARRLREDDRAVTLIDGSHEATDAPARQTDLTDVRGLTEAGIETAPAVIVATPSDGRNLLLAQLVRVRFDVDRVVVVVNEPDRMEALADAGHEPICATTILADAIVDHL